MGWGFFISALIIAIIWHHFNCVWNDYKERREDYKRNPKKYGCYYFPIFQLSPYWKGVMADWEQEERERLERSE